MRPHPGADRRQAAVDHQPPDAGENERGDGQRPRRPDPAERGHGPPPPPHVGRARVTADRGAIGDRTGGRCDLGWVCRIRCANLNALWYGDNEGTPTGVA
jgi:hypothetical protein